MDSSGKDLEHQLQYKWSLWYYKFDKNLAWTECQHLVGSVNTVEDFWSLVSYVEAPSKVNNVGCDYSFFKYGVDPAWEHPENEKGGRWFINLDKRVSATELDRCWVDLLMALVGDDFGEYTDEICGAVFNFKPKGHRLSIWTKTIKPNDIIRKIFEKVINLQNVQVCYLPHKSNK